MINNVTYSNSVSEQTLENNSTSFRSASYGAPDLGWNSREAPVDMSYRAAADAQAVQNRYAQITTLVVTQTAKKIRSVITQNKNINTYFHEMLQSLATYRNKFAVNSGTIDAHLFGAPRNTAPGDYLYTGLRSQRRDYMDATVAILNMVRGALGAMVQAVPSLRTQIIEVEQQGLRFSKQIQLLGTKEFQKNHWNHPPTQEQLQPLQDRYLSNLPDPQQTEYTSVLYERIRDYKRDCPSLYQHDRMSFLITGMADTYPDLLINEYILVTPLMEINQGMCCLSQILIGMTVPLEQFLTSEVETPIFILHQDAYLVEQSLEQCATLFQEAATWTPSQEVSALKEKVALFRYLFAQATPFIRGSAAIGEWIEMSLYASHGYDAYRIQKGHHLSGDLAAFTTSLFSDYLTYYHESIELVPREIGEEKSVS